MRLILPLLVILLNLSIGLSAQADPLKQKVQKGTVITDGAVIYKNNSFDAEIVTYAEVGRNVVLSRKIYSAADGFGTFYKIRIELGVYGYVSDVDVKPQFKPDRTARQSSDSDDSFKFDGEDDGWGESDYKTYDNEPLLLKRWIGLGVNYTNITESFAGKIKSSYENLFSLKLYGPRTLLKQTPTDFEISILPKVPSYYSTLSNVREASGFLVAGHWSLLLPLREFESFLVYYGAGLTFNYSSFEISGATETIASEEIRAGIIGQLGIALRLGKDFHLRGEGRYYYEEEKYLGSSLSIMKSF